MGSKRWKGGAAAVAQVTTLTVGGTAANGQVYTATMGYRSIAYTANNTDTNSTIAAALQALLAASTYGEFLEATWTVATNVITATANTAGVPFTVTSSATGTGTLTAATTTTSAGPNDVSTAANWDANAVPVAGDDVYIDHTSVDLLWNLQALSGVALNSLTIDSTFQSGSAGTGTAGLPEVNQRGSASYLEYRQQYLQQGAATCTVGNGTGAGSGRIKLDFGTAQTTLIVNGTGAPADAGLEALLVKGTNASNVATINSGSVAIAGLGEESATLATLNVGSGPNGPPSLRTGAGCTVTTLNQQGGVVLLAKGPTTVNKTGGSLAVLSGNVNTWNERGGGSAYLGTGTIGTILASALMDFSQDPRARTVNNATFQPGGGFADPFRTVTWTNPFTITANLSSVSVDWGNNVSVALTYN